MNSVQPDFINVAMSVIGIIVSAAAGAFGAYVAIRSDLAAMKAIIDVHSSGINRAHERIDNLQRHG